MAGIAHARHAHLQKLRIVAAVRFVAVGAIFEDRRMLPKEGPAAFGVAAQAVLVRGRLDQLLGIGGAVWIVAARAGDLALSVRHMRRALQLPAPHQVALQAQLGLVQFHPLVVREGLAVARIGRNADVDALLDLVAIDAGNAPRFVGTPFPEDVSAAVMAVHTNCVLFGHRVGRILPETNGNGVLAAAGLDVGAAGAVAGLTAASFFKGVWIAKHDLAHDRVLEAPILILVAADASIAADVVARRPLWSGGLRLILSRSCLGLCGCGVRMHEADGLAGRGRFRGWELPAIGANRDQEEADDSQREVNCTRRYGSTHRPSDPKRFHRLNCWHAYTKK